LTWPGPAQQAEDGTIPAQPIFILLFIPFYYELVVLEEQLEKNCHFTSI